MTEIVESTVTETTAHSVEIENTLSTEQIQALISQLSITEEGENLATAMRDLKKALKANPAACAALLPEDIGAMVSVLKKITGKDVEDAANKKKNGKKKEKVDLSTLSQEQQQEVLDDLF